MKNDNCVKNYTPEREETEKYVVDYICRLTPAERENFFKKLAEMVSAE